MPAMKQLKLREVLSRRGAIRPKDRTQVCGACWKRGRNCVPTVCKNSRRRFVNPAGSVETGPATGSAGPPATEASAICREGLNV